MELNPEITSAFLAAARRGGPPGARELLRHLRRELEHPRSPEAAALMHELVRKIEEFLGKP